MSDILHNCISRQLSIIYAACTVTETQWKFIKIFNMHCNRHVIPNGSNEKSIYEFTSGTVQNNLFFGGWGLIEDERIIIGCLNCECDNQYFVCVLKNSHSTDV